MPALLVILFGEFGDGFLEFSIWWEVAFFGVAALLVGLWLGGAWLAVRASRRWGGLHRALAWPVALVLGPLALVVFWVVLRGDTRVRSS